MLKVDFHTHTADDPHDVIPHSTFDLIDRAAVLDYAKPLVGNGDIHRLRQLGSTYSLVEGEADADAICSAVAAGRVAVDTHPLSWPACAQIFGAMLVGDIHSRFGGSPRKPRPVSAGSSAVAAASATDGPHALV